MFSSSFLKLISLTLLKLINGVLLLSSSTFLLIVGVSSGFGFTLTSSGAFKFGFFFLLTEVNSDTLNNLVFCAPSLETNKTLASSPLIDNTVPIFPLSGDLTFVPTSTGSYSFTLPVFPE